MAGNSLTDLTRAREGFRRFAQGFTPGQKAVTVFAILAAVVGGVAVTSITGKPSYTPLFTNLKPADASSITAKLASGKIPYKLADGGTTVMVPANDVNQERLTLAQAGLPTGGSVGLSLLDKEGITASNMTQQADYLQAIQGELQQTIDSIQGVAASQVNVALPANQDFALNNDSPTGASVMVTMLSGQTLSSGSVQAIVHLVGSSVPNLDAANVTVADSAGNLLAGPGMSAGGASNSETAAYDNGLQAKVQQYLTAVLGANNADVQVNATLNYDQVAINTQRIVPAAKGVAATFCSQTSDSSSTYNGSGTPPGGAVGTVTTTVSVAPTTGNGSYVQTTKTATCETNQETKTVNQAVGTVTAQSVAVLINSKALPQGVQLASLQQGVAAAAGINTARGDTLAFSSMPFNTVAAQAAAKSAAATAAQTKAKAMSSLIRTAVVMLIIGLVLFLVWRSARKARKAAGPLMLSPAALAALQGIQPADDATIRQPAIGMAKTTPTNELATLTSFIDNQPDDVAELLRSWLDDKRELVPS